MSNLSASRRSLLQNQANKLGVSNELVMRRYVFERFLDRLASSGHRDDLVLKGAMALIAVTDTPNRPTKDMDMLGIKPLSMEEALSLIRHVASIVPAQDDAVEFVPSSFQASVINEASDEPGTRILGEARIGNARIPLKIEISHGQAMTPGAVLMDYPTVLGGMTSPKILVYSKETMLAEKFEAIVSLGTHISRFKDFFDVRQLARKLEFDGGVAAAAFRNTFGNRGTEIPMGEPAAFDPAFAVNDGQRGWTSFLRKQQIKDPATFGEVIDEIRPFVMEIAAMARWDAPERRWTPGQGWSSPQDVVAHAPSPRP
jgi:predicted nucleotidyltransferase component of viral defense system